MNDEKKIPTPQDMDTVRFFSLVTMFASSAYQGMGKLSNPLTGKVERNLDSAQGFIDILIMLRNKTKDNLTEDEDKLINATISDLQMNFVKEKEKPEPPPAEEKEEGSGPVAEGGDEKKPAEAEPEQPKAEGKEEAGTTGPIITPPPDEVEEGGEEESTQEEEDKKKD